MGSKIAKRVIFSVFLSVIGLYLLCFNSDGKFSIYDLWLLVGAFFFGIHILVVDRFSKVHPVKTSCVQFLVMGLLSLIPMFIMEAPAWANLVDCKVPLLYSGFLACGVAFTLQIFGQKHTFPILASLILCLESVFAVLGGALILGEVLTTREIVGCVLMISSFIIANTKVEQRF
jgi:drug/metabolite transporter (DMT)-like permease